MGLAEDTPRPDQLLVTPTRRLAHLLRARFDADCDARGLKVWRTLDALPWQAWVEQRFQLDRQAGRLRGRWLPPAVASLAWRRLVQDDPGEPAAISPAGLARAAHRSWRRMHAYSIPFASLVEEDTPETRRFARWAQRYSHWLAERGAIDADVALPMLSAASERRSLRLPGFDELAPAQATLLERLRAGGIAIEMAEMPARRGELSRVECRDARAELESAARWAAARLDRDPRARLAIVVPDLGSRRAEVQRTLERVLLPATGLTGGPSPGSQVFELAAARPLSQRPMVVAALDLLDAFAGTTDLAGCSRLLRNPYLRGAALEATARAMLDVRIRRHAMPGLSLARLARLAAERDCPMLAVVLEQALQLARRWSPSALPSAWSSSFFVLLAALGWPGEGASSVEHQTAQRWRELLTELAAADELSNALGVRAALQLLREMAADVSFEPQEIEAPLLVIDPETSAGMSFDALWVCGMEAGRWPPPAAPDPFLPLAWQVRQRLPGANADLAQAQAERLFERLARSADEVIVSVAQFDADAPVLPSALLAPVPQRTEPLSWPAEFLAARIHAARPVLESLVDARMPPPALDQPNRGGARLLELQSACPFRASAELRLHSRPLDEPGPGLNAAERGTVVHKVLARIWQALRDQAALLSWTPEDVRQLVLASIEAEIAPLRRGSDGLLQRLLTIESEWLALRAQELLEADRARLPFTIEALEAPIRLTLGGLTLALKLDRVDRLRDGSLAVIDYKTGGDAKPGAWLGERPRLPQLPLYLQAVGPERVAAVAFGRVRAGSTGYAGIARDPATFGDISSFGGKRAPRGYASWDELLSAWRERLQALAAEYTAGDARLAPEPATACRYCHLPGLCRINETVLRSERDAAADD
ncbi:MAG TPA: PD-(D/E)XK nuclease family protein [Steroidobacteraceae bacterium]